MAATSGTSNSTSSSLNSLFSNNRVSGLMSGLDTENLVKAMAANTKTRLNSKKQKLQTLQWKQESYRDIISKISSFQEKYLSISSKTSIKANAVMNKYKTECSSDKVSASAVSNAIPATYTIKEATAATKASLSSSGVGGTVDMVGLDFSGNKRNTDYELKMKLDGTEKTIKFNSGASEAEAKANFLAAANSAFAKIKRDDQKFEFQDGTSNLVFNKGNETGITHTYSVGYNTEGVGLANDTSNMIDRNTAIKDIKFTNPANGGNNGVYSFSINGVDFTFKETSTIGEIVNEVNKSSAGVTMTFSSITQSFKLESNETGTNGKIEIQQKTGNLINSLFNMSGKGLTKVEADKSNVITVNDGGVERKAELSDVLDTTASELKFTIKSGNTNITRTITASNPDGKLRYDDLLRSNLFVLDDGVLKAVTEAEFSATDAGSESEAFLQSVFGKTTVQGEHSSETFTTYGKNGTITISADGENYKTYTSASNDYTFDGTTINIGKLGNFKASDGTEVDDNGVPIPKADEITITTSKDTSSIKDTVVEFVKDYNELLSTLYDTMTTARPKDKGAYYDPLTEEQEEEMTKEQIEKWNENAKKGMLYQDGYINNFIMSIRSAMSKSVDGFNLYRMGVKESDKLDDHGKLIIDETKLEAAIEGHGDEISKFFTDTNKGLAARLGTAVDNAIANSASGKYGYLTKIAGIENTTSEKKNSLYSQINSLQRIIKDLETKYQNEMERHWKKFTALETLMAKMQQQSSYFMQE